MQAQHNSTQQKINNQTFVKYHSVCQALTVIEKLKHHFSDFNCTLIPSVFVKEKGMPFHCSLILLKKIHIKIFKKKKAYFIPLKGEHQCA